MAPVLPQLGFRAPHERLRGLVSSYYWVDSGDFPMDDMIHPEWANIRFTLGGEWVVHRLGGEPQTFEKSALFGVSSRGARVTSTRGSALLGIGLLPLGWARLIGGPARRLTDIGVSLDGEWPEAEAMREDCRAQSGLDGWAAVLDRYLLARLAKGPPAPPLLARAHEVLLDGDIATVERYAAAVGVSVRTLERQCGVFFGLGPKALLRRQRFLRTLDRMVRAPDDRLASLLPEGYADQSHFIHEFKAFMGVPPSRYLAQPRIVMQRVAAAREAMFGKTLQGLQAPDRADFGPAVFCGFESFGARC